MTDNPDDKILPGLTRRTVLAAGGLLALSPHAVGATAGGGGENRRPPDPASGESLEVARFVAETPFEALPAPTVKMTRLAILDAIGVSMAAAGLEPACRPFLDLAFDSEGGDAVVMGTSRRCSIGMSALANGALAHALDYEDAHEPSFTHPNAATVAAAVSVADGQGGVSGKEFISAVAVGCDLVCRLALAQGRVGELPVEGFYPPAIVGTFGAAAAAARLLRLDARQTVDAMSLALCVNSCSAEILFSPYSDIRAIRDAFCAQAGVQAALLARRGVKGFAAPFEGKGGFFAMYAGGRCLPGVLTDGLGERFAGQDISFKAWPACRATHFYIQAILENHELHATPVAEIESVRAFVKPSDMIVCEPAAEKRRPRAAIDAKFSLYFTLATALRHGKVDLGSFDVNALGDAATLALADKIHYTVDAQAARPRAEGGGDLLVVRLADGSERRWGIDRPFGSPQNPMSDEQLVGKFIDCGLASPNAPKRGDLEALAANILSLDDLADVRSVTRRL
jgi:2-methylcitrate dehydratase PrpD